VVVGNAAHTLHPVAGQGLNLSLRDVATLAEYLADSPREALGSEALLQAYARARAGDYRRVFGFTDLMVRGFSNRLPGVSALRDGVLLGLDLLPGARRAVVQRAMGRHGWTPRLMRGVGLERGGSN
jgi:2-octaprenyl-6-methoxyphenol hydroxylase